MKLIKFIIPAALLLSACQKEKTPLYSNKGAVWFQVYNDYPAAFTGNRGDTTRISFAVMSASATDTVLEIPVALTGNLADKDRSIQVKVAKNPVNASSKYELLPSVIPANGTGGTARIKIFKTANLDVKQDTITLQLEESTDLTTGYVAHLKHCVIFSNLLERPSWWDDNLGVNYLGRYNEDKLRILFEVLGSLNAPYDPNVSSVWRYNKYLLDQYILANTPVYADGTPVGFGPGQ